MKKIKFIVILYFTLGISLSCEGVYRINEINNDNPDIESNDLNPIIGKWSESKNLDGIQYNYVIIFRDDFSGKLDVSQLQDGEYTSENERFTWSTEENRLTMIGAEETEIVIYSITLDRLSIDLDSDGSYDLVLKKSSPPPPL